MLLQYPNEDVAVENQPRYLGVRILRSHARTSRMSSRSAHMPTAGSSTSRGASSRLCAVSLATGLPRSVTVADHTCCTFLRILEVLRRSSLAVTTIPVLRAVYTSKCTLPSPSCQHLRRRSEEHTS